MFPLDVFPEVELLDHVVLLFLIFLRKLHTVFHSDCISLKSYQQYRKGFPFLHIHTSICYLVFFLNFIYLFIYLWLCWVFRFCARAFSSCGKRGPLFIAVHGPLTIAAFPVAEHRFQTCRLSNCGSRA